MGIMVRETRGEESGLMDERRAGDVTSLWQLLPEPQLPSGWEKCLDLKSGLIYFKDWNSGSLTYRDPRRSVAASAQRIGLLSILLSSESKNSLDEQSLELTLNLPGSASTSKPASSQESSVCTMEKVRSALERSHWPNPTLARKRASPSLESTTSPFHLESSSSSQCSQDSECCTSPSIMSYQGDDEVEVQQPRDCRGAGVEEEEEEIMVTVGCRRCLMFVMLSKSHPCCPKCGSTDHVLLHLPAPLPKRQRRVSPGGSWSWSTA